MDVEKTIQFILDHEARLAAQIEDLTAQGKENSGQIKQTSGQLKQITAHLAQTDRQLKVLSNLMQAGLKRLDKQEKTFEFRINALIDAQGRTDKKLDRL